MTSKSVKKEDNSDSVRQIVKTIQILKQKKDRQTLPSKVQARLEILGNMQLKTEQSLPEEVP